MKSITWRRCRCKIMRNAQFVNNKLAASQHRAGRLCVRVVYVWLCVCPRKNWKKTDKQDHRCRKNVFLVFTVRLQCNATRGIYLWQWYSSIEKFFLPRCMQCRRGLAMRIRSVCLSVRLSVRPSVMSNAWFVTKWKKDRSRLLYHTKYHLAWFCEEEWLVGATPSK